jgi:hypothetical protein
MSRGKLRLRLVSPDSAGVDHFAVCPFCQRIFDMRELDQVLEHYDHQLAAGATPAEDLTSEEDQPS